MCCQRYGRRGAHNGRTSGDRRMGVLTALAILAGLAWAIWRGQFEALDAEGERILHSD